MLLQMGPTYCKVRALFGFREINLDISLFSDNELGERDRHNSNNQNRDDVISELDRCSNGFHGLPRMHSS
jgi:hypothetical protein